MLLEIRSFCFSFSGYAGPDQVSYAHAASKTCSTSGAAFCFQQVRYQCTMLHVLWWICLTAQESKKSNARTSGPIVLRKRIRLDPVDIQCLIETFWHCFIGPSSLTHGCYPWSLSKAEKTKNTSFGYFQINLWAGTHFIQLTESLWLPPVRLAASKLCWRQPPLWWETRVFFSMQLLRLKRHVNRSFSMVETVHRNKLDFYQVYY